MHIALVSALKGITNEASLLDAALIYANLGWKVFPIHGTRNGVCLCKDGAACTYPGKHPIAKHGYRSATDDVTKIRRWWRDHPDANIGLATGKASKIVILDIDPRNGGDGAMEAIAKATPDYVRGAIVATGGGGWHIYFEYPGFKLRKPPRNSAWKGIDIQGDGKAVVAPPSMHVSNHRYTWLDTDKGIMPMTPSLIECLQPSRQCNTEGIEASEGVEASELYKKGQEVNSSSRKLKLSDALLADINRHIQLTIPTGPGERHAGIMEFARYVKFHPDLKDIDTYELRPIVEEWFRHAEPNTKDKDFKTTWGDFLHSVEHAKYPLGCGVREVWAAVHDEELPDHVAANLKGPCARLYLLCRGLSRAFRNGQFFLTSESAGEIAEVSGVQGWRLLNKLCELGYIRRDSPGKAGPPGDRKAGEFTFLDGQGLG